MARSRRALDQACRSTSLPRGITKARPTRRSARLQQQRACWSLAQRDSNNCNTQVALPTAQPSTQKRKRDTSDQPERKRQRSPSATAGAAHEEKTSDSTECSNPIDFWRTHQRWPRSFFEPGSNMSQQHAGRSSSGTPRRKASAPSVTSSEASGDRKSTPYHKPTFTLLLETTGSFLGKYVRSDGLERGPLKTSSDLCRDLLEMEQDLPQDSLFSDDFFEDTCEMIQERNEAKVIQDIARLIVPSAQTLSVRGSRHLRILVESVNEAWAKAIPSHRDFPHPKPDYSVGFKWSSFTKEQFEKLKILVGDIVDRSESRFAATYFMYFPFLTCEVKCGAAALDIADRQNAHSATIAVRAVVELFRLVKREKELHRKILAFSVSHDHNTVRIYGHYPVIDGKETTYYRHSIRNFSFTEQDGKDKWTAYRFTKNVYDNWMPDHFKWICSAIDEIPPDINFDVSQESELHFSTGLAPEQESLHRPRSESSMSVVRPDDGSSVAETGHTTPDTSVSQTCKKPRRRR